LGLVPADAELSRHDPDVAEWDSLSAEEQRLYAHFMAVFAGFLEHTDFHIGRLFDFLRTLGEFDNTIIFLTSDNGASSEGGPHGSVNENLFFNNVAEDYETNLAHIDEIGGPTSFNHYPWGWTFAGNTPFRRWKRETYRGGISDPFIVQYLAGTKARGEVRSQYLHAIDWVPTVLELPGIEPPGSIKGVVQSPIEGFSFAETLDDTNAEDRHKTQYFEMLGHRAIYHDGWRAVCPWPGPSFAEAAGRMSCHLLRGRPGEFSPEDRRCLKGGSERGFRRRFPDELSQPVRSAGSTIRQGGNRGVGPCLAGCRWCRRLVFHDPPHVLGWRRCHRPGRCDGTSRDPGPAGF